MFEVRPPMSGSAAQVAIPFRGVRVFGSFHPVWAGLCFLSMFAAGAAFGRAGFAASEAALPSPFISWCSHVSAACSAPFARGCAIFQKPWQRWTLPQGGSILSFEGGHNGRGRRLPVSDGSETPQSWLSHPAVQSILCDMTDGLTHTVLSGKEAKRRGAQTA